MGTVRRHGWVICKDIKGKRKYLKDLNYDIYSTFGNAIIYPTQRIAATGLLDGEYIMKVNLAVRLD